MLKQLEPILKRVEKPGRYVGGEVNAVCKDWDAAAARIALAFPDVYDVGMSYHGYRILYERINGFDAFLADRVYTPWPDMDAELRAAGLPLYSLDQMRPLAEFDIVGFTLQYELNYTNVLAMLELGGIPLYAEARGDNDPLIIAGGEGALAPEPLAMFIDAFVFGDGEEVVIDILHAAAEWKKSGLPRAQRLECLQDIPGVYVPALFECEYAADNTVSAFYRKGGPRDEEIKINKRLFNLAREYGPVRPVVPMVQAVHDRFAIEIKRGCTRGCRFCAAGMITRPIRERTPEQILEIAQMGLANTGYRDLSLLSLSSADYTCILPTVQLLNANLAQDLISISLPSLRINAFDVELAAEISKVKKTGFTFAPEAGTERLRRVISKVVDQEHVFKVIDEVCAKGWQTLKFYFMLGLPTEDYTDLDGIVEMIAEAYRIGRRHHGNRITINVSLSPFVPKPHTPFQWEPQLQQAELKKRYEYVAAKLKRMRGVSLKRHDTAGAQIEAVLARGDRRVGRALLRAYELGCRFDGWSEWFRYDLWTQALQETGIDMEFYANRARGEHEILPWDHVEVNLGKRFLWKERKLAYRERDVFDCSTVACVGCEACAPDEGLDHSLVHDARKSKQGGGEIAIALPEPEFLAAGRSWLEDDNRDYALPAPPVGSRERDEVQGQDSEGGDQDLRLNPITLRDAEAVQRLRLGFSKTGRQRFLSHLDMMRGLQMIFSRLDVPLAMTKGFSPKPVMQFTPSLGLGIESECEFLDVSLHRRVEDCDELLRRLNRILPEGICFHSAQEVPLRAPALDASVQLASYRIEFSDVLALNRAAERIAEFNAADSFPADVKRKRGLVRMDLKDFVARLEIADGQILLDVIPAEGQSLIGPAHILQALLPELDADALQITRTRFSIAQPHPAEFAAAV